MKWKKIKKDKIPNMDELLECYRNFEPATSKFHIYGKPQMNWMSAQKIRVRVTGGYEIYTRIFIEVPCVRCGSKRRYRAKFIKAWEIDTYNKDTVFSKNYKDSECYKILSFIKSGKSKLTKCPKCGHKFEPVFLDSNVCL